MGCCPRRPTCLWRWPVGAAGSREGSECGGLSLAVEKQVCFASEVGKSSEQEKCWRDGLLEDA